MSMLYVTPESEDRNERALSIIQEVPFWVIESILIPRGVRLAKKPTLDAANKDTRCCICLYDTPPKERAIVSNKVYHMDCYQRRLHGERQAVDTSGGAIYPVEVVRKTIRSNKDLEIAGNLGDSEYHLWIGTRMVDTEFAVCRCCKKVCNTAQERTFHKVDVSCFVGGKPCYEVITQACKAIAPKARCVVCRKASTEMRYGVNLCDWYCVNTWKFDQACAYLDFRCAIMNIKSASMEKERARFMQNEKPQFD